MAKLFSAVTRLAAVGWRCAGGSPLKSIPGPLHGSGRGMANWVMAEVLESRTHLSVARDADGWTVVSPEPDSRVIYVSSSTGDDANSGRSPDNALRSVAAGAAQVRDGSSDQLLLKRGDLWEESIGRWSKSGSSAQEPILIGAYGTGERPRLNTGEAGAFELGRRGEDPVAHVSVIGLHLSAHTRLPGAAFVASAGSTGMRVRGAADNVLIEDCRVEGYKDNIALSASSGRVTDVTVRRSVVLDAYSSQPAIHAQGLYASGVEGLVLEENVFDHNGWLEGVAAQTMFNHNVYIQSNNENVVIRGNLFSNASSHGLQARAGGRVEDNLFLHNPIGMSFGFVNGAAVKPGGVAGLANGNVFLGANSIGGGARGWGLEVGNTRPGAATLVSNNIFAAGGEHDRNPAMVVAGGADVTNEAEAVGVNDLTLRGNIVYDWSGGGLRIAAGLEPGGVGAGALNGLTVRGNDFQSIEGRAILHDARFAAAAEHFSGNRYDRNAHFSGWQRDREPAAQAVKVAYADPSRTAGGYSAALGGEPTTDGFVREARAQSAQSWRPQYTPAALIAYVRAGHDEPGIARDWSPPVFPTAVAHLPETVRLAAGGAPLAFDVSYAAGEAGLDVGTLDGADLRLSGRRGFAAPAALVGARPDGARIVATYAVVPPDAGWGRGTRGAFTLVANPDQVRDMEGRALEAAELAKFTLAIDQPAPPAKPAPPDRPPTVKKVKFAGPGAAAAGVTAWFSEDVSASIDPDDLYLLAADGSRVDPAAVAVSYDPARHAATWTFPGLPGARPPAGKYRLVLPGWGITDAAGQMLDGDRNGQAGDDFAPGKPITLR